jgi:glycosyltransferase involved in cell wall biosynthesis
MEVRRRIALRTRKRATGVWPIMPGSEQRPQHWPGWPDGKKFAFVLTHDVETTVGLERCRDLMQLDMDLGFRSSFNFVPEGEYQDPRPLREELAQNGFEVGIHDLRHDGRLYQSDKEFRRNAVSINRYVAEWGAVGFRSAFMLHKLDWLHQLNVAYDASTFDTDPFEPQPQGRNTIFPFWVPAPNNQKSEIRDQISDPSAARPPWRDISHSAGRAGGYVELPYTLPQDSTLFILLREETPEIWIRKLDWIAAHGGMALINVHPDYCSFDNDRPCRRTYPVSRYRDFLQYVVEHYRGSFWQPLPWQIADFVKRLEPKPKIEPTRRVCMVTHSYYLSDNRVTRYAEALAARGDHVDVFALRRSPELPKEEIIQGVHLFRIQDRVGKTERSKLAYLWPLLRFLRASSAWIARRHALQPYDLLHIHNVPDFMVFSAWYPKLKGARVILDIHDIVPEFFASKFGMPAKGLIFSLLVWMERISAAFADYVIIANHLWRDKYAARTNTHQRCTTFINNVDTTVFTPRSRRRQDGKQIILFPGGLQWHQGVDIAIRAFKHVSSEMPNAEFHIYGDGSAKESLVALAAELGLNGKVRFFKPISVREIAAIMAEADLGVVPKRADSFGNEAYSTKIMEFMSVGVPVVVSSTKVDRYYFDDSVVRFFEPGDPYSLAREIIELLRKPELRSEMTARAAEYAARNSWENRKTDYLNLVDSLCASNGKKNGA